MSPQRPILLLSLAAFLAACSAGAPATPVPATPAGAAAGSVAGSTAPGVVATDPPAAVERPAWQTTALTDVTTGEAFTIADLAGKLVVVEPMAAWCVNCLHQQREAATALAAIDSDQIVYISLDVDPAELPEDLAAYSEVRGFPWRFAIADRTVSRSLAEDLGDQVLSPPSTPKIFITPDGTVIGPEFGMEDAKALEKRLRSLLG